MKVKRGEYGYIRAKKRNSLLKTLLMVLLGVAVFVLGLFLNHMSNRNLFTVVAVLFVLPGAKFLVAFIVLFPYRTPAVERYEKVKAALPDGMELYSDLVITSSEKVMGLDFAAVGNGQVIGLAIDRKQDLAYIRHYLGMGVKNWGQSYKVKVEDNDKKFLEDLSKVVQKDMDREEEEKVRSYLVSLIV